MKIGEAGEAFFVFETDSDVPDDLITSPLLEPTQPVSPGPLPPEDFGRFGTRNRRGDPIEDGLSQEPDFLDLNAPSTSLSGEVSKTSVSSNLSYNSHGLSFHYMGSLSSNPDTRSATMPIFVEAEKDVSQKVQASPVDSRRFERSAISPDDGSSEKPLEAVQSNDGTSSWRDLKGPSALYSTDIGGVSYSTSL